MREIYTREDSASLDEEKARAGGYKPIDQELPPRDTEVLRGYR